MALANVKSASPRNVNSIFSDLALALVLIAFLFVAVGKDWFKAPQGTYAAEMKIIHQNAILRLAGSDIVGDRLGPELAEAFLQAQGCDKSSNYFWSKPGGENRCGCFAR